VHKEKALADIVRRYPSRHYVLVDDKLRILAAVKKAWGKRLTAVFVRQGKFAHDPKVVAAYRGAADVTVDHISDLLQYRLPDLLSSCAAHA
jgi:phosphatidate phosphatase APP1